MKVEDLVAELHEIFDRNFDGSLNDPLKNSRLSSQYRCPNKDCDTNIEGRRPYGRMKMSVVWAQGYYHCWVCGLGSKTIASLYKYLDAKDQKLFLTLYAQLHPKDAPQQDHSRSLGPQETIGQLFYKEPFKTLVPVNQGDQDRTRKKVLHYLASRGITEEQMHYYNLLYAVEGTYKNCVIIPSYDSNGHLNFFTGRIATTKRLDVPYKNPTINRNGIIFNECFINWSQPLILCEGPFDYLALFGFNRTALLGSELSEQSLLFQTVLKNKTPIRLLLDQDANKKAMRIARSLKQWGLSDVSIIQLPVKDPGELTDLQKENLKTQLSGNIISFRFEDLLHF